MRTVILCATLALAISVRGQDSVSAKDFGAKGDGVADDTIALQEAIEASCMGSGRLYLPSGTYDISSPLTTACEMVMSGDGASSSILRQTLQRTANHGLVASHSLTLRDLAINTAQLTRDYGMAAVFRKDTVAPADGQRFMFERFNSSGFNFSIDVAGTGTADLLGPVTVRDCDLSVGTAYGAVSQPVNVRTAASVVIENNTLTGDGNNDHGVYLIAARKAVVRNNAIRKIQNSAIKILNGGFCGRTPGCEPDTGKDYSSWTIERNHIGESALAVSIFLYGTTELPLVRIEHNEIRDIVDDYASDAGAVYINVNDTARIASVSLVSNTYDTLSLGGIFLVTSGKGAIGTFEDHQDSFANWSVAEPGMYSPISSSGAGLETAVIDRLALDARGKGRTTLNLQAFSRVTETK